jgi:YD repeat-containing protein
VTDREGRTTEFAYDGASSRISTITDARGHVALTLTYDAQGRVATQQDARGLVTGEVTTFDYVVNPDGTRVTTVTSPPTSFEPSFLPTLVDSYDANGWLASRASRPSSSQTLSESYTYDAIGNRGSVTDARGNTTLFCYDRGVNGAVLPSRGNLTRRIDPPPTPGSPRPVTLIGYDSFDNPIQTVSPRGVASNSTTSCTTDLSAAVNGLYATDLAYDPTGARLLDDEPVH